MTPMSSRITQDECSGIYRILCRANQKAYIGSAVNIKRRWMRHRNDLRSGQHHSTYMQRSYDKHGEDAFVFEVLEECAVSLLVEREQDYLDQLRPAFNTNPLATSSQGRIMSDEEKHKHSIALIGRKRAPFSKEHRHALWLAAKSTAQSVAQLDIVTGETIATFRSQTQASLKTGISQGNISRALRKGHSAGGFNWVRI